MNDFTKEELELISECIEADFYHTNWSKSMYEPLINKIQSMIDNYCEHQDRVASSDENGHMVVQCGRCDSVLWHEKD